MREIKFRAWDKIDKHMCYNAHKCYDTLTCDDKDDYGCKWGINSFGDLLEDKDIILMQYTGLKDKNGKEIYEGDIIVIFHLNHIVKYKAPRYYFIAPEEQIQHSWADSTAEAIKSHAEVIGNIYENPELLKEKHHGRK